eukprot:CAMPEP_0119036768 /NCGR_PEP_ID=MMETSP1177-20130426/4700_1 /TAXON_ID=2985 /ORGANISM="Ochromonas sp, Strain CCMP1899" /LENGTH=296 /DNA_ID=CAMNT_0006997101 /DNA_START=787 /DNA_END=1674 /DNA_ORIENTATION=+
MASLKIRYDKGIEYGEKTINEKSIVLMGHSMGALSASAAAATYLYDDIHSNEKKNVMINENALKRKNITLVLVSPAFSFTKEQRNQSITDDSSLQLIPPTPTLDNRSVNILEKIVTAVKRPLNPKPVAPKSLFKDVFTFFKDFFKAFAKLPVKIMLRRAVHSDSFWYKGLASAWGGVLKPEDVYRYKLASMAKGFDDDLFRFVTAQKTSAKTTGIEQNTTSTTVTAVEEDYEPSMSSSMVVQGATQVDLLASLLDLGCRVVIVHGTKDRIVPLKNSQLMLNLTSQALAGMQRGERE